MRAFVIYNAININKILYYDTIVIKQQGRLMKIPWKLAA